MFWRYVVPPTSWSRSPRWPAELLDPEKGGTTLFQNMSDHLPPNTGQYPGRLQSSGRYLFVRPVCQNQQSQ